MSAVLPSRNRIDEIDVLRGLCAIAVVLYHYVIRYDAVIGFSGAPNPGLDVDKLGLRDLSTIPVFIFFIISGFVIYMTIERAATASEFLVSRFSRIFPVYWTAVVLTYTSWKILPAYPFHISSADFLFNLTMIPEFFYRPLVDATYWSLRVELAFYAGMALLMMIGRLKYIRLVCAAWLGLSMAYGYFGDSLPIYYRVAMLLDLKYAHFFVSGIVLYRIWRGRQDAWDWALLAACVLGFFVSHIAIAAMIMTAVVGLWLLLVFGRLKFVVTPPLVYLGSISYALYLTHQMIGYQIISALPFHPAVRVLAALVVALMIASLMTLIVEQPALRLIRRAYAAAARPKAGVPAASTGSPQPSD